MIENLSKNFIFPGKQRIHAGKYEPKLNERETTSAEMIQSSIFPLYFLLAIGMMEKYAVAAEFP